MYYGRFTPVTLAWSMFLFTYIEKVILILWKMKINPQVKMLYFYH